MSIKSSHILQNYIRMYLLTFSERHHMHACFAFSWENYYKPEFYGEPEPELVNEWMNEWMNECSPVMMLELGSGSNLRLVEWYSILAILHNRKEEKKPYHVCTHVLNKGCVTHTVALPFTLKSI
jgi:hypothetical protein